MDPERGVKDGHEPLETLRKWGNDIITNLKITSVERIRYAFSKPIQLWDFANDAVLI